MALIGSLVIGISARTADLERGLNRARQQVQSTATSIRGASAGIAASFGAVSAAIGAIGASKGLQEIIRVGTAMEGTRAAFTAITGSAEKARAELAFVSQVSQQLSTDLLGSTEAFKTIAAAARGTTLEGKATREIFLGVSQAARVLQLSAEDVQGVLLAVSQIMSKGTVSSEELRGQIGERLPGAFNIAARAIGVTTQELSDMLQQGRVLSNDFLPKFAAQLQREFAGGVEKATQTAGAAFQRARNDITAMATAAADSGLLRWLANAAEGFTKMAAAAVGASRTTRNAISEINTQAPGASEQQQRQFVDLAERRARTMQRVQEIEDSIARSTIGKTYLGFDLKQRQQQIANLKEQVREIDRLSQALLDNQRKLEEAAGRETITELPTKGVFETEKEKVKKQVDEMRQAMDAVKRQADIGMPGLDVAQEQSKILLKGLQDITEELAKYPGLAANLPKAIQDTIASARLDVIKQTITDITARSKEMRTATAAWKEPLEQNREELRFIENELDKLVDTFGVIRDGQKVLDLTVAPETAKEVQALIQRVQELRQGLNDVKDARKADRAEATAAAREAKQAEDFLESLRAEAKLRQESLKIRNQETEAGQRQIALMELEATIRDRGITLDPTQRAEAERLALMKASAAISAEDAAAREAALNEQREAQRQILTGMAQEINLRGQLLGIQKLGTTEREIAEKALTMEAELIANGTTITDAWRTAVQQLATAWGETGAAIEKAAFFRDLSDEIAQLEQLLALQNVSREEREREIAILEARQQLNRTLSSDEEAQLRREITVQQERSAALEKATFFRDLGEDTADLRALVAAQRLSRREREIELALIQEKRRLNRALAPEEEAQLKRQLALQRDLNEELSRPRPLRDFAESTQDFFLGIEEGAVRALEGLEDALVRFAETGSFRSPEAEQTLADLRGVAIERRALIREMETLQGLPQDQQIGEALRQKERLNQLQREVDILDERKKVLDDTAKSQNMLNKLFAEFYNQLLQASVRQLFTGPLANQAQTLGQGQQGNGWGQLLQQGISLLAGIFGGGGASFTGATQTPGGINTDAIISHTGGVVGRDAFPRISLPRASFAHAQRFATGGIVMSRGGDNVPALLQSGERVLSRQETTRLAQLEQAVQLARNARQGDETPQGGHTFNMIFPNVATRQDADALRRSGSQIQNQLITAVERNRARGNISSTTR